MRVEAVTVWQLALPLRAPFATAAASLRERHVLLVRVDAGGLSGWGEAAPVPGYSEESVDDDWTALADGAGIVGIAVGDEFGRAGLPPSARAALAGALADLAARRDELPLWRALGGMNPAVPAGAVAGLHADPDATVAEVDGYVVDGYRSVKLKIAPRADRDRLAAVRRRHPDLDLGADANASYRRDDLATLAAFDEFGLRYLEQPLPIDDLDGHAELAARTSTPVCLDESLASVDDVRAAVQRRAAQVLNLKPGRVGGADITVAMLAAGAGLRARAGGMLETGVGRAHLVALATLPGFDVPGDISASARYFATDVVDPPWRLVEGCLEAPDAPGIGVAIDEAAVAHHAVRKAHYR